jgi:ABC-type transporter MlaC component
MADPTILTTEQLLREVANAVLLLESKIAGKEEVTAERLSSVETQFSLIERQRVEQKADTEKAVQAALSAAKEAVKEQTAASDKSITKSETATAEQLRQLTVTFDTAIKGLTDILSDTKDRVGKIESRKEGATFEMQDSRANQNTNIAAAALTTQIRALYVAVVGLAVGGGLTALAAIITHGFK